MKAYDTQHPPGEPDVEFHRAPYRAVTPRPSITSAAAEPKYAALRSAANESQTVDSPAYPQGGHNHEIHLRKRAVRATTPDNVGVGERLAV